MFLPRSVQCQIASKTSKNSKGKKRVPSFTPCTSSGLGEEAASAEPGAAVRSEVSAEERGGNEEAESSSEDDEPVVSYSKQQRWPKPGEPVCVMCGRYGAYIVDTTDQDICSLECKARHLHKLGRPQSSGPASSDRGGAEPQSGWGYTEHPEVAATTSLEVEKLRTNVNYLIISRKFARTKVFHR